MKKPTRNEAMIAVRIDADVKERADLILMKLGVSTKTLIDALYKQVVYTNSVPFSLSLPEEPAAMDLLNKWDLDAMLERSYEQASQGEGKRLVDVAANSDPGGEYEVFLTTGAEQSLDDAWNYFAIDLRSPEVADRYVSRLADDTAALGENPYKHELVRGMSPGGRGRLEGAFRRRFGSITSSTRIIRLSGCWILSWREGTSFGQGRELVKEARSPFCLKGHTIELSRRQSRL